MSSSVTDDDLYDPDFEPSTPLRFTVGALLVVGAVLNLAGIFPAYNQNSYAISKWSREGLIYNLGTEVLVVTIGLVCLIALHNRKVSWGAMGSAVAVGGFAFAVRFGDIASNVADGTDGAWGWWLQSAGDLCTFAGGIAALVWLYRAGASTLSGPLSGLMFGSAVAGMLIIIVSQNADSMDSTLSGANGRVVNAAHGNFFKDFGWSNSGHLVIWIVASLIAVVGPFLLPRIVGACALLASTIWLGILEVLGPWSGSWGPQELDMSGVVVTVTTSMRPVFYWTVVGWALLIVATFIAFTASQDDDDALFANEDFSNEGNRTQGSDFS